MAEQVELKVEHVQAEVKPETVARITPDANLDKLRDIAKKEGGRRMWEKVATDDIENTPTIHFDQIRSIIDSTPDVREKARLEEQEKAFKNLLKEDPNKAPEPDTIMTAQAAIADITPFVEAIRVSLNDPALTIDNIKQHLEDPAHTTLSTTQQNAIRDIVKYHISKPEFKSRLEQVLGKIKMEPDHDKLKGEFEKLTELRSREADINTKIGDIKTSHITPIEGAGARHIDPADRQRLASVVARIDNLMKNVNPSVYADEINSATLAPVVADLRREQAQLIADLANMPPRGRRTPADEAEVQEKSERLTIVRRSLPYLDQVLGLLNPADEPKLADMRNYMLAQNEISKLDQELRENKNQQSTLKGSEQKLAQEEARYRCKLEHAMETSVKGYWNDVILERSQRVAEAEAEEKKKAKTEKAENTDKARNLLDRFLLMSLHRIDSRTGEMTGWKDKWIKDMVNQIGRVGPADIARTLITNINSSSDQFTSEYRDEARKLLEGLYDTTTTTPTLKLDNEALKALGNDFVPKLYGYARARRYWWGIPSFSKKNQREFIRRVYGDEFWVKSAEAERHYDKELNEEAAA